jgi:hypothetical protein
MPTIKASATNQTIINRNGEAGGYYLIILMTTRENDLLRAVRAYRKRATQKPIYIIADFSRGRGDIRGRVKLNARGICPLSTVESTKV